MGYDTVHGGFRHGQVKAFGCGQRHFVVGDPVEFTPDPALRTYSVRSSEGTAWINVVECTIVSLTDEPTETPTFWTTGMLAAPEPVKQRDPAATAALLQAMFPDAPAVEDDPVSECGPCAQVRRGGSPPHAPGCLRQRSKPPT